LTGSHRSRTGLIMSARDDVPVVSLPPLVRDPVGRTILSLALPGMLGVLAMMSTTVLDMYLARFLGLTEQAALQQVFPVSFLLTSISLGLTVGTVSLVARTRGANDLAAVRRITGQAVLLSAILISVFSIIGLLSYRALFARTNVPATVLTEIGHYLSIWFFGTLVMVFPSLGNGVLRACGNAIASSSVLILVGVLKLAIAPVMVLGLLGFPRLGLAGAALSSIICYASASLLVIWYLRRDRLVIFGSLRDGLTATWRNILVIGLPSMLTNALVPVCGFIANLLVTPFGNAAVAGYGNALRVESLALIPMFALSGCIGPFLGQNSGAARLDRMREGFAWTVRFSLIYGIVIAVLLLTTGHFLSDIFAASPQSVVPARLYLWLVPASYGFYGVLMVVAGGFNGLGNPKPNLVLYTGKAIFLAAGLLIGAHVDGFRGICLGVAFSNFAAGAAAYLWYRRATNRWPVRQ
jgi:putative MATE family efflux protein